MHTTPGARVPWSLRPATRARAPQPESGPRAPQPESGPRAPQLKKPRVPQPERGPRAPQLREPPLSNTDPAQPKVRNLKPDQTKIYYS